MEKINNYFSQFNGRSVDRLPIWKDTCTIKENILGKEETSFTLSPLSLLGKKQTGIDIFSSKKAKILTPPSIMVGFKSLNIGR